MAESNTPTPDPFDFNKPQLWPMWIDRFGHLTNQKDGLWIHTLLYFTNCQKKKSVDMELLGRS